MKSRRFVDIESQYFASGPCTAATVLAHFGRMPASKYFYETMQTMFELSGIPCIRMKEEPAVKGLLVPSRSFSDRNTGQAGKNQGPGFVLANCYRH